VKCRVSERPKISRHPHTIVVLQERDSFSSNYSSFCDVDNYEVMQSSIFMRTSLFRVLVPEEVKIKDSNGRFGHVLQTVDP
jgi:hypothetical protein